MIELLEVEHVLDAARLEQIPPGDARGGGRPSDGARLDTPPQDQIQRPHSTQIAVGATDHAAVVDLLESLQPQIDAHFGRRLHGFESVHSWLPGTRW